ncbi:MAG: hypothetical protein Q9169_006697 [Polycauliona sp. 2 TL-2023]
MTEPPDFSWDLSSYFLPSPPSPCAEITARNSTHSKLLSLPIEIRRNIYLQCLVSSSPIVVWSARKTKYAEDNETRFKVTTFIHNPEARAWDIRSVFVSLLRCCRYLASDAAAIFYRENTFVFSGDHDYYRIIAWLDQIGHRNRNNLSALEISAPRPSKAWQLPDGTRFKARTVHDEYEYEPSFAPRHPHLTASLPMTEGEVDVINPAIETIISFFARPGGIPKIRIVFQLEYGNVPGMSFANDIGDELGNGCSMDFPNLVEKWRTDYTFGCLEVLWRSELSEDWRMRDQDKFKELGWELLEEESMERPWFTHIRAGGGRRWRGRLKMECFLRKKKLTGPLLATDLIQGWTERGRYHQ